jgi:hypothetical protein
MRIDRHNYEEYFLLYVDNELNADQKRQVELFVKQNADLEEELVMLQQSRLIPDNTIVFKAKDILMRAESGSFINLANYEEWLVLYVDDELNAEEKTAVEKFAALHPHVQVELGLFQQTKLQPEEFKFPDKESLYRGAGKVRIISMTWWRAAAAILIIAAGVTTYSVWNTNKNGSESGGVTAVKNEQPVKRDALNPLSQQNNSATNADNKNEVAAQNLIKKVPSKEKVTKKETIKRQPAGNLTIKNSMAISESPKMKVEIISDLNAPKSKGSQANIVAGPKHKHIINDTTVTKQLPQTPDDYASSTENKRLRGFFRKATRFIERTSGINPVNDDDRLLISAMAVNLK